MQKVKRTVRYVRPGISFDWWLAGICFVLGGVGLRVSSNSASWQQLVEQDEKSIPVGNVIAVQGRVRHRKVHSSVWQDMTEKALTREGDSISTGEDGVAILTLMDQTQVKILANSLIVVHLDNPQHDDAPWWSRIAKSAPPRAQAFVEVKRGGVNVAVHDRTKPLKLMAQHREMTLDAARTAGDVSVQIDPNLRSGVRVSQAVPSAALAPPRRTPAAITPQILGPVHKAKFVASKKQPLPVAIRWSPLPEGLKPEVELTRFDDPEFRTPLTVTTLGASVDLPLGAYSFRVRTSNDDGKTSEWSPRYEFSLHEHIDPKAAVSALTVKRADSPEAIEAAERMRKVVQSQEEARQRREAIAAEESKRKQDFVRQQTELRERARVQREILAKKQAVLRAAEEVARKEEIRRRENLRNTRYLAVIQAAQERTAVLAPAPSLSFSIRQKISEATPSAGAPEAPTPTLGSQRSPAASTELKDLSRLDRLNISLDWNPIQGAKEYHLEVFRGGDRFKNEKLSRNHYDLELNELDPSKKITYEISTTLPNGREIRSGITPVAVQVSSPRPVEPPSEAMANLRTPVLFSWAKTVLTDKYDFQLSSDATFSQLLENKELDANYATLKITQPGVYFWRVRGKSRRFTSDWSAPSRLYLRTN